MRATDLADRHSQDRGDGLCQCLLRVVLWCSIGNLVRGGSKIRLREFFPINFAIRQQWHGVQVNQQAWHHMRRQLLVQKVTQSKQHLIAGVIPHQRRR